MDASDASDGISSWNLHRSGLGSADGLEKTLRTLGGREYFAHRNEVILRCGEIPTAIHLILDGTLQVLALGEFSEKHPFETVELDQLESGRGSDSMVGILPWLEQRVSRFSFRVLSKSMTAIMVPSQAINMKAQSLLSNLHSKESSRENAWEASAILHFEERRRVQEEADEKIDDSGLQIREEYLIPPECLMACHPNLPSLAPHRRDPPPPVVEKSLQEVQREKRFAQMDVTERQRREKLWAAKRPNSPKDLDLDSLLSMDGGHARGRNSGGLLQLMQAKQGGIFHPKTSTSANNWRRSEAYRFCRSFPVFQPELDQEDRRLEELPPPEDPATVDRQLRSSMARMIQVLMQVKNTLKTGVRKLYGKEVRDAEDMLNAMSPEQNEKLARDDVAEAIHSLGVTATEEHVQELVTQMDTQNTGIDREELVDAFSSPKSTVRQIYRRLRPTTIEKADSLFSSDGGEDDDSLFGDSVGFERQMEVLPTKRMSLHLPVELQRRPSEAFQAMPSRPCSAPLRPRVVEPSVPKPVGKYHAMQRRMRRKQLRSAGPHRASQNADPEHEGLQCPRLLVETVDDGRFTTTSRPTSQSLGSERTRPLTPRRT